MMGSTCICTEKGRASGNNTKDVLLVSTDAHKENNQPKSSDELGSSEGQNLEDEPQPQEITSQHKALVHPEMDGGWGWMVVLGCAMMHCLLGGWSRCYGIIYVKLREKFQSSAAITAWVGGAGIAIRMGGSPVATALAKRFSVRSVTFIGGVVITIGILLTSFGPSIEYMFFPISFVAGIGGCLIYSPAIVHVGEYFDKKRGIATGISTAGSGLGVFLFPPLMDSLFQFYGFTGAFLIFGSIMFNCCVSAMLYRPLRQPFITDVLLDKPETTKQEISSADSKTELKGDVHIGLRKYLDYKLLCDIRFLCFAISLALVTTSYMSSQIIVTDHAIDGGLDETRATLLLSVVGAADIFGRLGSGILFDLFWVRPIRRHVYQWSIALTSVTLYGWGFSSSFEALLLFSIFHGLFNGCVVSQRAVIVAEIMGIEQLSSSFGLTVFFQGFGALLGPLVAGLLKDQTGNYVASFIFTGTCSMVAFVILYAGIFYDHYQTRKKLPQKDLQC